MPDDARLVSLGSSPANADIARRLVDHAGVAQRVEVVVGTLGDGGRTIAAPEAEHGFGEGRLDVVLVDHDEDACLPDLERIVESEDLGRASA